MSLFVRWAAWLVVFGALGVGVLLGLNALGLLDSQLVGGVAGLALGGAAIIGAYAMTWRRWLDV